MRHFLGLYLLALLASATIGALIAYLRNALGN